LIFTNSCIPISDNSLPYPEFLIPPKGSLGSLFTIPFTKLAPD